MANEQPDTIDKIVAMLRDAEGMAGDERSTLMAALPAGPELAELRTAISRIFDGFAEIMSRQRAYAELLQAEARRLHEQQHDHAADTRPTE